MVVFADQWAPEVRISDRLMDIDSHTRGTKPKTRVGIQYQFCKRWYELD